MDNFREWIPFKSPHRVKEKQGRCSISSWTLEAKRSFFPHHIYLYDIIYLTWFQYKTVFVHLAPHSAPQCYNELGQRTAFQTVVVRHPCQGLLNTIIRKAGKKRSQQLINNFCISRLLFKFCFLTYLFRYPSCWPFSTLIPMNNLVMLWKMLLKKVTYYHLKNDVNGKYQLSTISVVYIIICLGVKADKLVMTFCQTTYLIFSESRIKKRMLCLWSCGYFFQAKRSWRKTTNMWSFGLSHGKHFYFCAFWSLLL